MSTQSFLQEDSEQSDYDDDNDGDNQIEDECNSFVHAVSSVFEDADSRIYLISPHVELNGEDTYVNIEIGNKKTNKACAKIQYLYGDKTILIDDISKCGNAESPEGSGTDIINRLIAVGHKFKTYFSHRKDVKLQLIIDSDQSKIKVGGITFELNWLYLFSTGETWYNRLGFREEDYDKISECIRPLISAEIKHKFKQIMHNIKEISKHENIDEKHLTKLHHYHAELEDAKHLLSQSLNHERCPIRNKFSDISYDLYEVKGGNNKKRKTMRRTRKKTNKKNKKKTNKKTTNKRKTKRM